MPQALGHLNLIGFVRVVFAQPIIRNTYRHFVIRAQMLAKPSLQRLPCGRFVQQLRIARIAHVLRIVAIQHAFRNMCLHGFHALGLYLKQASRVGAVIIPFWRALRQIARMSKHDHSVIARSKRRLRTGGIGFNGEIKVGRLERTHIGGALIRMHHCLHGSKTQSRKRQARGNAVERLTPKPHETLFPSGRSGLKRDRGQGCIVVVKQLKRAFLQLFGGMHIFLRCEIKSTQVVIIVHCFLLLEGSRC